jgi:hypothetical protein
VRRAWRMGDAIHGWVCSGTVRGHPRGGARYACLSRCQALFVSCGKRPLRWGASGIRPGRVECVGLSGRLTGTLRHRRCAVAAVLHHQRCTVHPMTHFAVGVPDSRMRGSA